MRRPAERVSWLGRLPTETGTERTPGRGQGGVGATNASGEADGKLTKLFFINIL